MTLPIAIYYYTATLLFFLCTHFYVRVKSHKRKLCSSRLRIVQDLQISIESAHFVSISLGKEQKRKPDLNFRCLVPFNWLYIKMSENNNGSKPSTPTPPAPATAAAAVAAVAAAVAERQGSST